MKRVVTALRIALALTSATLLLSGAKIPSAIADNSKLPSAGADNRDAEPVDWDERNEDPSNPTYSRFWSGDSFPSDEAYQDKIELARTLWSERTSNSLQAAAELLERATAMEPDQVVAYAWLARITNANKDWNRCAAALDSIAELDETPNPVEFNELATVDQRNLARGTCHALAGNYETAVERFTAIVSAGTASGRVALRAKQRLAETFMALGRLEETIETLEQLFKRDRYNPSLAWLLTVAYDRNEQTARAMESYSVAKKYDPNFTKLSSSTRMYIPAEDEYYFLGLAYQYDSSRAQHQFATYYFREYLHHAKEGLWVRRAKKHLESTLTHEAGRDLRLYGPASMDEDKALAAIEARDSDFQDCVSSMPRALFRLRITKLPKKTKPKKKPKKKSKPKPKRKRNKKDSERSKNTRAYGSRIYRPRPRPRIRSHREQIKALVDRIGKPMPRSKQLAEVRLCLEQVAKSLKLPAPSGGSGTWSMVEFRVIAR